MGLPALGPHADSGVLARAPRLQLMCAQPWCFFHKRLLPDGSVVN